MAELTPARCCRGRAGLVEAVLDQTGVGRVALGGVALGGVAAADPDRIEAPYLQLVMQRLWEAERERARTSSGARRWRSSAGRAGSCARTSSARSARSSPTSGTPPPACSTTSSRPRGRRSRIASPTSRSTQTCRRTWSAMCSPSSLRGASCGRSTVRSSSITTCSPTPCSRGEPSTTPSAGSSSSAPPRTPGSAASQSRLRSASWRWPR